LSGVLNPFVNAGYIQHDNSSELFQNAANQQSEKTTKIIENLKKSNNPKNKDQKKHRVK